MSIKREDYRTDIDGLRAIAVIAVVLFHAQLGLTGGFVGVDIFFVISGFLITRILEKDLAAGRFSIMKFYERRMRRIFPAFFVMILCFGLLGMRFLPPDELKDMGKTIVAASAFLSNILFFRRAGYFAASSLSQPMLHTWTLSVEEQFYIFWPWVLFFLARFARRTRLTIILAIIVASVVLSSYWVGHDPDTAFYMLPSRAWELAIGALLSIAPVSTLLKRIPRWLAETASIAGLAMMLTAIFTYTKRVPFPGIGALLPCVGAALVIASGQGAPTLVGKLLSVRPMVWIGLISYSLYLWHWPILVFARIFTYGRLTYTAAIICVILAVLFSWLSWRFIERPFRNPLVIGGSSRLWVFGGLGATAAFLLLGLTLDRSGGFPRRSPAVAQWISQETHKAEVELIRSPCMAWGTTLPPEQNCLLGAGTSASGYNTVLWGDSNGAHLAPAFQVIDQQMGIVTREMTKAGCPPLVGIRFLPVTRMAIGCPAFNQNAIDNLLADPQVRVVVLAARWNALANGLSAAPAKGSGVNSVESRSLFVEALRHTVSLLTDSGRQVVLVSQVPSPELNPITCLSRARFNGWSEVGCDAMPVGFYAAEEGRIDGAFAEATDNLKNVRVVHPFDVLCNSGSCALVDQDGPLYWDADHLSDRGAVLLIPALESGIKGAWQAAGMASALAEK